MTATAPLGEATPTHVVGQLVAVATPTPARTDCPNIGPRPRWLPPRQFHCGQDHYLQSTYGITCDDYWRLFKRQDGRCAICRQPPGEARLAVDHDHDTGAIDGLCHFGCNRRLETRWRRYLADPPGRAVGLRVAPAKLRAIQAKDDARRERARERAEARAAERAKVQPQSGLAKLRAMTNQGGTS
jgi:hypothetical protein